MVHAAVQTVDVLIPNDSEMIFRLTLAMVLGGLIGLEREIRDHPAGIRTHISIALGSCLFGLLSAYGYQQFVTAREATTYQVDVTRIASQIVVGVGFLGGGAIIKSGGNVRGLTTAASIWVTAAIGLGAALGAYAVTLATTGLLLLSLVSLRAPQRWLRRNIKASRKTVVIRMVGDQDTAPVVSALTSLPGLRITSLVVQDDEDEGKVIKAEVMIEAGKHGESVLSPISSRDDVEELDFG